MVLDSAEVQTARAMIGNYETFVIAIWLYNYVGDWSLEEKKAAAILLKTQERSILKNMDIAPKLPNPANPKFAQAFEAAQGTGGESIKLDEAKLNMLPKPK